MQNSWNAVGRLTKDVDLRYTQSGKVVGAFTLAVERSFKKDNGDRECDFINCIIWNKPAEALNQYAKKGSKISVTGRMQSRSYENQQGQRVFVTECLVQEFGLLGDPKESSQSQNQAFQQQSQPNPFEMMGQQVEISDDDLPF